MGGGNKRAKQEEIAGVDMDLPRASRFSMWMLSVLPAAT